MASSNAATPGPPLAEQSGSSDIPLDTIVLHVLSPSVEVSGGRITFPSIPLDTKISRLKSRIQHSMITPAPPERQRLIYRGRPLLNMETTLRQVLQSELNASTDESPTYTFHLVISPAPGSTPSGPPPTSQNHVSQHRSTPPPSSQLPSAAPHPQHHDHHHGHHHAHHHDHHHDHQPRGHLPVHPAMAQAHAAQAMLQHQLNQLQQQIAITGLMAQGQGQGQGHRNPQHQPPQMPPLPPSAGNMQAFQAAIMQQQQVRAHAGVHGIHNPAVNGTPSGMPFGQTASAPFGPITTRVHESVGPDGQRTRVVVNETTFQISRQSTPVPAADRTEASQQAERPSHASTASGPQLPPAGLHQHRNQPLPFPPSFHHGERQDSLSAMPSFVPQPPAYQPTFADLNRPTASTTTTAWLLSSPNGPQALVFAPGHGLFTSAPPTTLPSARIPRPREGLRFQQTPSGHIRPQNPANIPALPVLDPAVANAQPQQALEAVVRARNAARQAAAGADANANADANNEALRTIMSRVWTFVKLYFVIFMFTEPGTWFRWGCIFAAAFVAFMPRTTVFRGFATRLQEQVDGLVQPPAMPVPAMPPPAVPGRRENEAQLREGGPATDTRTPEEGVRRQGEPDPTATAARLVEEHRQRQPNDMLWDSLQRAERAIGLFVASLIPGVGERHVKVRRRRGGRLSGWGGRELRGKGLLRRKRKQGRRKRRRRLRKLRTKLTEVVVER
ncbi:hypothetical protein GJ744_007474 [Endocarpon pusillum]|uniref:Ubiquitin-like domain-containing protein n=1 Tax=Endocarpon pusillum TaxID=364733 RepID=A0A8H7ALW9_9EURO|nr:hypothetical protein GJ744_007474 [Endocarpon pusillum]